MSLKAFHLFFIAVSTVGAFLLAAWCVKEYTLQRGADQIILALLSSFGGIALVIYGIRVRRKLKNLRVP